ncbi:MAG: hypothetical protein COW03_05935 [Cytophagales bacterium CG12_big_fil_rev_8_21_14_0_65_40_12]|nr:MAG: hypothetical protein COW03_05935 [Cytophagales bacterium CG12_big_fil_rev_8_21_14_0_65_40_12]PIW04732.1 MAG: hypothetical protein COW40_08370 [Cytophagales bacterium CG17_big_fil_post_rev_8_21_14_2_50_40_13]
MFRSSTFFVLLLITQIGFSQKTWEEKGISITQLDTLSDGYKSLRASFIIENSSIYEVMNLILDVDGYDWVEGESKSKMLFMDKADSSFTFDFFVDIPWLFVKKTGRVKVDVSFENEIFHTRSTQIREYDRNEDYDLVDFYSAQWKLQKHGENHVKVGYLGVYQDQKMIINLNNIIISRIRKRLSGTLYNLKTRASEKNKPTQTLTWPRSANGTPIEINSRN